MTTFLNIILNFSGVIGIVILFLVCARFLQKGTRTRHDIWEQYWDEERSANMSTQSTFPSHLLLNIDWDKIPHIKNEKCEKALEEVLRFKSYKMVYLKGLSNTEIKKQYGINFFNELVQYEETFYQFMKNLKAYQVALQEEGFVNESQKVQAYYMSFGYF